MRASFAPALCLSLAAAGCASGQLKQQQVQIQRLQSQVKQLDSRRQELEGQAKDKDSRIAALQGEKADIDGKAADLAEKLKGAQMQIDSLRKSNQDLSQSMEAGQGELAKKVAALVKEKDQLSRRLNDMLKEKIAAERAKSNLLSVRGKLSSQLASAERERDESAKTLEDARERERKAAGERTDRLDKTRKEMARVSEALIKEVDADRAKVAQSNEDVEITLQEPLLFEPQQAKLTEGGTALLDRLGAALHALPARNIRIEAHSDNAPMKKELFGGFASAWDLTGARAVAVARYLHEHGGLDPARLTASGLGEFRPVQPNDTPEGRDANRRIVVMLVPL